MSIVAEVSVLTNVDQCSICLLLGSVYTSIIAEISVGVLLLLLSYHRRLRMILRSARAARGRRSG